MLGLVIVLFSLFRSATITVDTSLSDGKQADGCLSDGSKCDTLAHAVTKASASGDTISTPESETISSAIAIGKSLTIQGTDPAEGTAYPLLTAAQTVFRSNRSKWSSYNSYNQTIEYLG